jgi:hypothetical protein
VGLDGLHVHAAAGGRGVVGSVAGRRGGHSCDVFGCGGCFGCVSSDVLGGVSRSVAEHESFAESRSDREASVIYASKEELGDVGARYLSAKAEVKIRRNIPEPLRFHC